MPDISIVSKMDFQSNLIGQSLDNNVTAIV